MCTAISNTSNKKHLFGRTLDVEYAFGESVIITPRGYEVSTRYAGNLREHFAIIGIGMVSGGVPLYFDAMNEHGLCAAALNFPWSAVYNERVERCLDLCSFELITYILATCRSTKEAAEMLACANITNDNFSQKLRATPMHWMISDKSLSIVVEPLLSGLKIYENPFGVLTNEPPFDRQAQRLSDFLNLSSQNPQNSICPSVDIKPYSNGMGAMGLPGDYSSTSRFVRATFLNSHASADDSKMGEVTKFFHITDSLSIPRGVVKNPKWRDHFTVYTSCADTEERIYYFSTYTCRKIRAVALSEELADADGLSAVDIYAPESIDFILPKQRKA